MVIRFEIAERSLCFVCAHLAAGQSKTDDRNKDFHEINAALAPADYT